MNTLVYTNAVIAKMLAAGGPLLGLEMGLYKTAVAPAPGTILTNLTEPTWTGYARVALGAPVGPTNPQSETVSAAQYALGTFTSTDVTANDQIYGAFIADVATHMVLYAVLPFASPVPITGSGASLSVAVQARLDPTIDIFATVEQ